MLQTVLQSNKHELNHVAIDKRYCVITSRISPTNVFKNLEKLQSQRQKLRLSKLVEDEVFILQGIFSNPTRHAPITFNIL